MQSRVTDTEDSVRRIKGAGLQAAVVWGLVAIVRRRARLTRERLLTGVPARHIGADSDFLLLPTIASSSASTSAIRSRMVGDGRASEPRTGQGPVHLQQGSALVANRRAAAATLLLLSAGERLARWADT